MARVKFPIVSRSQAELIELIVEPMPPLDRHARFWGGHTRPDLLEVLLDARANERKERRYDGIGIRFLNPDFSGSSYGLALALADKLSRYPPAHREENLIATGEIADGGFGRIAHIEGFQSKVEVVAAALDPSRTTVFAFPADNWGDLSPEWRERLITAESSGALSLRKVKALSDLADLWCDPQRVERRWRKRLVLVGAAAVVALAAGGAYEVYRLPARTCERMTDALDPNPGRNPPDEIAAAARICDKAARLWPDDGRLQFLAGQALQLNGSSQLAEGFWERAAALKDIDGMTTWGRHLWVTSSGDPSRFLRARSLLESAAKLGSTTAMEDLADLDSDGRTVPANPADAQRWRAAVAEKETTP